MAVFRFFQSASSITVVDHRPLLALARDRRQHRAVPVQHRVQADQGDDHAHDREGQARVQHPVDRRRPAHPGADRQLRDLLLRLRAVGQIHVVHGQHRSGYTWIVKSGITCRSETKPSRRSLAWGTSRRSSAGATQPRTTRPSRPSTRRWWRPATPIISSTSTTSCRTWAVHNNTGWDASAAVLVRPRRQLSLPAAAQPAKERMLVSCNSMKVYQRSISGPCSCLPSILALSGLSFS